LKRGKTPPIADGGMAWSSCDLRLFSTAKAKVEGKEVTFRGNNHQKKREKGGGKEKESSTWNSGVATLRCPRKAEASAKPAKGTVYFCEVLSGKTPDGGGRQQAR